VVGVEEQEGAQLVRAAAVVHDATARGVAATRQPMP
jgi:hypothetical protein